MRQIPKVQSFVGKEFVEKLVVIKLNKRIRSRCNCTLFVPRESHFHNSIKFSLNHEKRRFEPKQTDKSFYLLHSLLIKKRALFFQKKTENMSQIFFTSLPQKEKGASYSWFKVSLEILGLTLEKRETWLFEKCIFCSSLHHNNETWPSFEANDARYLPGELISIIIRKALKKCFF